MHESLDVASVYISKVVTVITLMEGNWKFQKVLDDKNSLSATGLAFVCADDTKTFAEMKRKDLKLSSADKEVVASPDKKKQEREACASRGSFRHKSGAAACRGSERGRDDQAWNVRAPVRPPARVAPVVPGAAPLAPAAAAPQGGAAARVVADRGNGA